MKAHRHITMSTRRLAASGARLNGPQRHVRHSLARSAQGGNRKGYAGYENDGVLANAWFYHVRFRMYHAGLGRWLTRDPSEHGAKNLFEYVDTAPVLVVDPLGLAGLRTDSPGYGTHLAPGWDLEVCALSLDEAMKMIQFSGPPIDLPGLEGIMPPETQLPGVGSPVFGIMNGRPWIIPPALRKWAVEDYWRRRYTICHQTYRVCLAQCSWLSQKCKTTAYQLYDAISVTGNLIELTHMGYNGWQVSTAKNCLTGEALAAELRFLKLTARTVTALWIAIELAAAAKLAYDLDQCNNDHDACKRYCQCKRNKCILDLNQRTPCTPPRVVPPVAFPPYPPGYPALP